MAKPTTAPDNAIWQACLLAMVGGFSDAVGFLTFGAFAGAMTGNTVLLGIALASAKFVQAAQSAGIIAAFLVGVAVSAVLRHYLSIAALLVLEVAVIVVAALLDPLGAALVLALAMGLQNAAMTHFAGTSINTVVLTDNLQKFILALVRRDRATAAADHAAATLVGAFWLSYLSGNVLGALAWHFTAHPLLYAILPLPLVMLRRSTWRNDG